MRWILRLIMLVVVLIGLGVAALFIIPTDRIAAILGDQFEKATGRSLIISGDIKPSLYPTLGVRAEGIEIGNPDWVGDEPMLKAQRMNAGVALGALFGGEIQVQNFELIGPEIVLVKGADGAVSWAFGSAAQDAGDDAATGGALDGLNIDIAEISDGSLIYRDLAAGTVTKAENLNLSLRLPSAAGMAQVQGDAVVNGARVSVEMALDGLGPLLDGKLRPISLALEWQGGKAGYDGKVGISPLAAQGMMTLEATDLGPVMALAGQAAPDLPPGLGRDSLAVTGSFTLASEGTAHLRDARFILDGNSLNGDIDFSPGQARPMIRARLQGGALDLSGLTGSETAGAQAGTGATGWSRVPIDVSALRSIDAEAGLNLAGLDLGVMKLGEVSLRATLTDGRLVLDLNQVSAYDGSVSGQYVVNGRGGLSMRGDLAVSQMRLSPLLTDLAGFERLEGIGSAQLNFLLSGNNLHALMNSLSGSGTVALGQGAILGLDIGGMIRNLDTSYQGEGQKTVYDSITASFTAEKGVVSNEDMVLLASFGEMTGSGTIGVGEQVVDYGLIPRVIYSRRAGEAAAEGEATEPAAEPVNREVRVPLLVSGAWSNLKYSLDLETMAEEKLEEQVEALQERAVEQAVEALGVEVQEGETAEQAAVRAARERLQEKAERQLQRLLGGKPEEATE